MAQWEYKSEYIALLFSEGEAPEDLIKPYGRPNLYLWQKKLQDELNKHGSEGWELVSIDGGLFAGKIDFFAVFKRQKEGDHD